MRFLILITCLLSISSVSEAKLFRNAYVSFELPGRWDCHLEGTEWVCSSQLKDKSREAIIILTAKEVGPSDTLEAYEQHLKTPRVIPGGRGRPSHSQVKHMKRRQIAGHAWVDSMHMGSEIPSYYTRYLATIKDRLAILVTFSAHQRHYTKYSQDFFKAIDSLKVVASKSLFEPSALAPLKPGGGEVIGPPTGVVPDEIGSEEYPEEPSSGNGMTIFAIALLIAAVGGYLFLKKRS
jgi:hypothetical protein